MSATTQIEYKFIGRIDHMKAFIAGIKALNFSDNGFVQISEEGMRVTVEKGKSVQASLFITHACFHEFHVEGTVSFGLNINVMYDCLTIFGNTESSIKMTYKDTGSPLVFIMHPHGTENVMTEVSIKTAYYSEPIDFDLDENDVTHNALFLRGPDFSHIFSEIDKSADELEFNISPTVPYFKINMIGLMQSESSVCISKFSAMMLLFNCRATTQARYRCTNVRHIAKALSSASKVAIKTDSSGLLEMHFMLQSEDDEAEIYIQFYIIPLVNFDD